MDYYDVEPEDYRMNGNGRLNWLEARISIGNILAIVAFLSTALVSWARMDNHMNDGERHQTILEKQAMIRQQVDLMDGQINADIREIKRHLESIDSKMDRITWRR